jgi:hypothetical protein
MLPALFEKEEDAMNINPSASLLPNASDAVGMTMLKKSIDIKAQSVAALVNSIPQPAAKLPANLGQNINTTA